MRIKVLVNQFLTFYSKMNSYITNLHGKTNLFLQCRYGIGIIYNYVKFRATISDYFELSFYKKSDREKSRYITSPEALDFAVTVDSMELIRKYFSKTEMYGALSSIINRDQLFTSRMTFDDFCRFADKHPRFIYKPDMDDCGHGVEIWSVTDADKKQKFMEAQKNPAVLDELVIQCPQMSALNPSSVNTIRLYSLIINNKVIIYAGFIRMGRNNSVVDNLGSGGLLAGLDVRSGKVITPATDDTGRTFAKHPDTGTEIMGFQVPDWKALLSFVKNAARKYPMKYVGWDIAVCDDSFQIIEANPDPMIHGIQTEFFGGRKKQYAKFKEQILQEKHMVDEQ